MWMIILKPVTLLLENTNSVPAGTKHIALHSMYITCLTHGVIILSFKRHLSSERGIKTYIEYEYFKLPTKQYKVKIKDDKYIALPGEFNRFPKIIGNGCLEATFPE